MASSDKQHPLFSVHGGSFPEILISLPRMPPNAQRLVFDPPDFYKAYTLGTYIGEMEFSPSRRGVAIVGSNKGSIVTVHCSRTEDLQDKEDLMRGVRARLTKFSPKTLQCAENETLPGGISQESHRETARIEQEL